MKDISSFLTKFRGIALKELQRREAIQFFIKRITEQVIEVKDIEIKNGIIAIKSNQSFKSEIFLKKRSILDLILKSTGTTYIDIK
ncbi:MAG: hypothetical protein Q7S72_01255 [Candidatus Taylorbacteria bacterium]|nr:hypothetical protein [Candidatus Taylorbacteria bacterium]